MVTAKFKCTSNENGTVKMWPVTTGSEENEKFYSYTPGGNITLSTINEEAAKQFVVGNEYYVNFTGTI